MVLQAFPIGSPLVPDVSRAVLEVTEGDKMGEIEKAWIGLKKTCPDSSPSLSSNSLSLESFWGLFLIAGISSFSALTIYIAIFIYEHRDALRRLDPKVSTWRKLVVLGSQFNQKDLDSHTFRKAELCDKSCHNDIDRIGTEASPLGNYYTAPSTFSLQASPHTNCPPSPSSFSNLSIFPGDQGNPTWEHGELNSNGQVVQEIMPGVELATPDQEREITSQS